ncbi:MAG: hypothetical protein L7F78_22630 [Syntrophales bacterium LBB04]|nr:hypothetical protein [Syntrophales bacterium LBB04]
MLSYRDTIQEMLTSAGITINGSNPWDIQVADDRIFSQVLKSKNLALGEACIEGWWDCQQLDEFINKILKAGLDGKIKVGYKYLINSLSAFLFNRQSKKRSRMVAEQHYDLDNNLFMSFLDPFKWVWDYYLLSCAGAFRARNIQLWQIVLTRYGTSQPSADSRSLFLWGLLALSGYYL